MLELLEILFFKDSKWEAIYDHVLVTYIQQFMGRQTPLRRPKLQVANVGFNLYFISKHTVYHLYLIYITHNYIQLHEII